MILFIGIIILLVFIIISIGIFKRYNKFNYVYDGEIVIILGLPLDKNSRNLRLDKRLDECVNLLKRYPKSICILTGGYDKRFNQSVAYYMKQYLRENHLIKNTIILEDSSYNVKDSIKFSNEIIKRRKLNRKVIVVTDDFNQFRAQLYCKKYGLYPSGISSKYIDQNYLYFCIKEILSLIKFVFDFR